MPLILKSRIADPLPVSLAGITPAALAGKSLGDIERTPIWQGNRQVPLAELFDVSGDASVCDWRFEGDLSSVDDLALGMDAGEVHIAGPVGNHAGQGMRGGRLTIEGDAGDWLGAAMRKGHISVAGSAGDHVGGSRPAAKVGMRGGRIVVHGNAGTHAGERMRRGWVSVAGDSGAWAAHEMRAGTLMVLGQCGARPGAGMRRGTIALLGSAPQLLPTFRYACHYEPVALALLLKQLADDVPTATELPRSVALYNGDLLEGGRGEVLVAG